MSTESSEKQLLTLHYGTQLRHIKSMVCQAELANKVIPGTFSPEDMTTLQMVQSVALTRARKTYEEARRRLETTEPSTDSRTAQESRTYNGK